MVSLSQLYYTMVESRYVKHTLLPCPVRNISSEYPDIGDKAPDWALELSSEFYGRHNTVGDKYLEMVFIDKQFYFGIMSSRQSW